MSVLGLDVLSLLVGGAVSFAVIAFLEGRERRIRKMAIEEVMHAFTLSTKNPEKVTGDG